VSVVPDPRPSLPVACSLGPGDGQERLEAWRRIAIEAGTGRTSSTGRIELRFRELPGVGERLRQLVVAERECCPYLGWHLERGDDGWCVEITGRDEDLDSLPIAL
jgi:hypothetical protein